MAHETSVWRGLDGQQYMYITGGAVEIRLTFPSCFTLKPGLTAADIVRLKCIDAPLLRPGDFWRFMDPAEIDAYEMARAEEADAA